MVKKSIIYIFIYTLLVGCDTLSDMQKTVMGPTELGTTETDCYLEVSAPNLELDVNGYYHMEWLEGYVQTFSTLDANTGSEDMYQKVYWDSDSGIYENFTNEWVPCVNQASYTKYGVAHTVLSVWEENIGDTVTIYSWYQETLSRNQFVDSLKVIVKDEI